MCNYQTNRSMGRTVVEVKEKIITTTSGQKFVRRETKVEMPNGKFRYPVDYYDPSPNLVHITYEELERKRIPVYKQVI